MRILVTGGGGVIGQALLAELLKAGHEVRLFTRHAGEQAREWPEGVEPWQGDVSDEASVEGSAAGCQAIIHVAGIARERPPQFTFERVNVKGTRLIVREAERAGRPRLLFVSSLGAERGHSAYHASKRTGEQIVRGYHGDWRICRPGNVYGPGDDVISLLLTMVRTLPAIPVIDGGDQPFQPVWTTDLAEGLARAIERDDLHKSTFEVAGAEVTTLNGLLDEFVKITGRNPARVPVPGFLAAIGSRVAGWLGADLHVSEDTLTMLAEVNVVRAPEGNLLPELLGRGPTPLADGLRSLADSQPLKLPTEGVGDVARKSFRAAVSGSRLSPEGVIERVRTHFADIVPELVQVAVEPGATGEIRLGETLTLALPGRGHVQVRCVEHQPGVITLVTVSGHPLVGAVRFLCAPRGDGEAEPGAIRVEIQVFDQASNALDWLALKFGGEELQSVTWEEAVRRIVIASGGMLVGDVTREVERLDDDEAGRVADWLRGVISSRTRAERETSLSS